MLFKIFTTFGYKAKGFVFHVKFMLQEQNEFFGNSMTEKNVRIIRSYCIGKNMNPSLLSFASF